MDSHIHTLTEQLYQSIDLSRQDTRMIFDAIIQGDVDPIVLSSFLTALKIKGETPEEIAGAAQALLDNAKTFPCPDYDFADIVGTGGDGANTINISTTAAFVAAACGVKIAKHGNRSVSSQSGSSDLLAELGIDLTMNPTNSRQALDDLGVCFLFAPHYHQGVHHAMPVRQTLKTRTIFNVLGPLINPARPNIQLMGVYDANLVLPLANTLAKLGLKRAAVVHGSGLDEVALHGETLVAEVNNGQITEYTLTPEDFGIQSAPLEAIKGGDPQENKIIIQRLLQGHGTIEQNNAVAINVALLLRLFGQEDIKANTQQALNVIHSGKAATLVEQLAQRGLS